MSVSDRANYMKVPVDIKVDMETGEKTFSYESYSYEQIVQAMQMYKALFVVKDIFGVNLDPKKYDIAPAVTQKVDLSVSKPDKSQGNKSSNLPKMRTIPQLVAEYKAADPDTPINPNYIRTLIKKGKIPFLLRGHRYLINADIFSDYIAHPMGLSYSELKTKN